MSETKWATGKFHVTGDGIHRIVRDEVGRILAVRHRVQKDENEALMNLFAAAPELYHALLEMEREKSDYMIRNKLGDPANETTNKLARAALAKARGEQP
jgi:hypothetical protein